MKTGLANKQSANQARKKKLARKPKGQRGEISVSAKLAEHAMREKAAKDQRLNLERQRERDRKAQAAQINQLIESSKIDRQDAELAFNFTVKGKIKTFYVNQTQQRQLVRNQIAIVPITGGGFELVPRVVADKIAERDSSYLIPNECIQERLTDDDPYADYEIPDDLIW